MATLEQQLGLFGSAGSANPDADLRQFLTALAVTAGLGGAGLLGYKALRLLGPHRQSALRSAEFREHGLREAKRGLKELDSAHALINEAGIEPHMDNRAIPAPPHAAQYVPGIERAVTEGMGGVRNSIRALGPATYWDNKAASIRNRILLGILGATGAFGGAGYGLYQLQQQDRLRRSRRVDEEEPDEEPELLPPPRVFYPRMLPK